MTCPSLEQERPLKLVLGRRRWPSEGADTSSVQDSILLEDGQKQLLGKKDPNIRPAEQNKKSLSSLAPSSCLSPRRSPEASALQKMERESKRLLNEDTSAVAIDSMNLKRKHVPCNSPSKTASRPGVWNGDTDAVNTSLGPGDAGAPEYCFCDVAHLGESERSQLMGKLQHADALVVMLVFEDGSTQLGAPQSVSLSSVEGIVMSVQSRTEGSRPPGASAPGCVLQEGLVPRDACFYVRTQHASAWGREQEACYPFARALPLQILKRPVVCFNAKDFVLPCCGFWVAMAVGGLYSQPRLKELEQEAHFVAGGKFLLTSNNQLREILFGKLKLHLLGPRGTLSRAGPQPYPSTSEAVLSALQDLHPLPKIILEYRQVHKIKSAFVDGLLACMEKGSISPTWNQTGIVTGRLSAKHPNMQGISKHPVQIAIPQNFKGEAGGSLTISPRAMFVPPRGRSFLAADFSQIELYILAHLSEDPELLKLFQESGREDVFSSLASQWKDVPAALVTRADREQAKKVVYAAVYGAGYVASIMGRWRPLPQIWTPDPRLRAQAERQAVNFMVQGSAADLCKMAMVCVSATVAASLTLTARLLAHIHDELLFEVGEAQVPELAALVGATMEALQHAPGLEQQLQVPLKVIECQPLMGTPGVTAGGP